MPPFPPFPFPFPSPSFSPLALQSAVRNASRRRDHPRALARKALIVPSQTCVRVLMQGHLGLSGAIYPSPPIGSVL